jgi:adenylyltransferase/sulfurtransferase
MDDDLLLRYSRQIMLPQVEYEGQLRLQESTALIIGMGGLGSPVALYLAAAGVGHLVLSDPDQVDLSNLQRQIIHYSEDIGRNKTESAGQKINAINPGVTVTEIPRALDELALLMLLDDVDVVLDCSDNFSTRFMVNRACFQRGTPLVSGAVIRMEGQLSVFDPRNADSPCYECLYKPGVETDETCSQNGVLAPLPGVIGSLQATEALKLLLGLPALTGQLLLFDAVTMDWRKMKLRKDPSCKVCATP